MKRIPLTQGKYALVDDEDLQRLSQFKWHANGRKGGKLYALNLHTKMHRFILNAPKGVFVDHRNGDTLDNRRCNLRFATWGENSRNRVFRNRSGYRGVVQVKKMRKKWRADIRHNGRIITIGYFYRALDAAIAYDMCVLMWEPDFGRTNILLPMQ
jgi:HNH endonuclease